MSKQFGQPRIKILVTPFLTQKRLDKFFLMFVFLIGLHRDTKNKDVDDLNFVHKVQVESMVHFIHSKSMDRLCKNEHEATNYPIDFLKIPHTCAWLTTAQFTTKG